jgi:hypothetical protein
MQFDDDYADEEWVDDDEASGDDLLVCPSCRGPVHEDTQQCPHCGDWITPVWPVRRSMRAVWILVVLLLVSSLILLTVC